MKKFSLGDKGISMSVAQSLSNRINQIINDIDSKFSSINNFEKSIMIGDKGHILVKGNKMPDIDSVLMLLNKKANLRSLHAFLMENIKAKDMMLKSRMASNFEDSEIGCAMLSLFPQKPLLESPNFTETVNEEWGWSQLTVNEINEYINAEAYSSEYGKFIHKGSVLDNLKKELPNIPQIEWFELKAGEKTPIYINVHHEISELGLIHERIAIKHGEYEKLVNYYKSKVKNLVTRKNAEISKQNTLEVERVSGINEERMRLYDIKYKELYNEFEIKKKQFEEEKYAEIGKISKYKIEIPKTYDGIIEEYFSDILKN